MSIPQTLADRLRNGRVIPFAGAGVSMAVCDRLTNASLFPNWRKLLEIAADRLDAELKPEDAALVRANINISPPNYLDAARRAQIGLGPVLYEVLGDAIDIQHSRVAPESLALAQSLWHLGNNLLITTNYDKVLAWACPRPHDVSTWTIQSTAEQASLLREVSVRKPTIWHLHGHIEDKASLVLTPDGYNRLYNPENSNASISYGAALTTLRTLLATNTFLFVGFSLDDDYVSAQLQWLAEVFDAAAGRHFVLVREAERERVTGLGLSLEIISYADHGEPLLQLLREMNELVVSKAIDESTPEMTTRVAALYDPGHPVFFVPYRPKGDQVVGRELELQSARNQLTAKFRTAIGQTASFIGLGGLGKTQLAVEYAWNYRDSYPNGVIWLSADQDIDAQLTKLAEVARWIAPESEHKYKLDVARHRLRTYSDCLVIFDNLEAEQDISEYLPEPSATPHILVTSRYEQAGFAPVTLNLLNTELSLLLLVQEAGRDPQSDGDWEAARDIVATLDGLPLALELAGAYLRYRPLGWREYHDLLKHSLSKAMPVHLAASFTHHESDLYSTLAISDSILSDEPHLREILDVLTWSGAASMSLPLLEALVDVTSSVELSSAFALGIALRLLRQSPDSKSLSIHRLVREVRREDHSLQFRSDWTVEKCRRIGDWFQQRRQDYSDLSRFESDVDHLAVWQEHATNFVPDQSSRLTWLQAYPSYHRGDYNTSHEWILKALDLLDRFSTSDLVLKAHLFNDLGVIYSNLGRTQDSWEMARAALAIRREVHGESHPDTATSLNNVGGVYGELGDYENQLAYSQKALAIHREVLGEKHPDTANSLNGVGSSYGRLGNHKEHIAYALQALAICREVLGEKHPFTANALNNVGAAYGALGVYKQRLDFALQALAIHREVLGEKHPDTANSLIGVGSSYGMLGNYKEHLAYALQALAIQREVLGDRHRFTAYSLNSVGSAYSELGDYNNGLAFALQALAIQREVLGVKHPSTAVALKNVGSVYGELGGYEQRLDFALQALAIHREMLGEKHPDTAASLNDVASAYGELGDYETFLAFALQALAIRRDVFGEKHPDTAASLNNVGSAYGGLGNHEEHLAYALQALAIQREVLGEKHPDTANSLNGVGSAYGRLGNHKEHLAYALQALAIQREVLGEKHPETATSLNNVGGGYGGLNDHGKELAYFEQALAIYLEVLGEKHPSTAIALNNVGAAYGHVQDWERAFDYGFRSVAVAREALGSQHPRTIIYVRNLASRLTSVGQRRRAFVLLDETLRHLTRNHASFQTLEQLAIQLLSHPLQPGFRQPKAQEARQYWGRGAKDFSSPAEPKQGRLKGKRSRSRGHSR